MPLAPGTLIGQYRILSLLGEGGMGAVYYAEHLVLGRAAAIKTLLPHVASASGQVERFINEARIAARMNHRNVVDVLDCGMFPSPDDPNAQWYIALEYLHGSSLSKFIAESPKPIDFAAIVHVLGEAANGLHAAHERHQLVHRDIKPDNLFLIETEDDPLRVKILDFGIAKLRQADGKAQTRSHVAMGTPAYAAPEQLRESKDVDARADVWALGVVAHEMLTGVRPWGAALSTWEIIAHHSAMRAAPDPRVFRPDLPAKLAEAVSRAMEPDLARRWRSTRDFARAFAEAAPMPFSGTGLIILEKYAPELTRGSSHSLTVGRELPRQLEVSPAEILTGGKHSHTPPLGPMTGDVPGWPMPPRPVIAGPETKTISTLGAASGQAILVAPRRGRGRMFAGGAALGVVSLAVVLVVVYTQISREGASGSAPGTTIVDAGATAPLHAAPATSSLAIESEPPGATISVDGVPKGRAPLKVQVPVGTDVEIRAELPGREPVRRSVPATATPATVRLELPPTGAGAAMPAATAPPPSNSAPAATATPPSTSPSTAIPPKGGRDGGRVERRRSAGSGAGSGSDTFNANDVL